MQTSSRTSARLASAILARQFANERHPNALADSDADDSDGAAFGCFRQAEWRLQDVELVKKTVMLYGLAPINEIDIVCGGTENAAPPVFDDEGRQVGRWDMIRNALLDSAKNPSAEKRLDSTYGVEDVRMCAWELCRRALHSPISDPKELSYLAAKVAHDKRRTASFVEARRESLAAAGTDGSHDFVASNMYINMCGQQADDLAGSLVPEILTLERQENAASLWAKRMRILDSLADGVSMLRSSDAALKEAAEETVREHRQSNPISTVPWWDHKCDIAVILGIYDHGYGNYDDVRADPRFKDCFDPKNSAAGKDEGGGTPKAQAAVGIESLSWPPADTLTRRVKRILELIVKLKVRLQLECEVPDPPSFEESTKPTGTIVARSSTTTWNKKETNEMLRLLMMHGLMAPVPPSLIADVKGNADETAAADAPAGGGGGGGAQILEAPEGAGACWTEIFTRIRDRSGLTHKSVEAIEEGVEAIVAEALQFCVETDSNAARVKETYTSLVIRSFLTTRPESCAENISDIMWQTEARRRGNVEMQIRPSAEVPRVMSATSSVKLVERLEMVDTFLNVLGSLPEAWEDFDLSIPSMMNELPVWWRKGIHDKMLVLSVLRHGLGKFDPFHEEIFEQFKVEKARRANAQKETLAAANIASVATAAVTTTTETDAHVNGGTETGGAAGAAPLTPDSDHIAHLESLGLDESVLPKTVEETSDIITPKVGFRRLRYLMGFFKRELRKQGDVGVWTRAKSFLPDIMMDDDDLRARRQPAANRRNHKHPRANLIVRDENGIPVLPTTVTEKLTLHSLGRIEYVRPAYHSERHLFPIGFVSRREHASMKFGDQRTIYTNEICDGGFGPMFRVTPDDAPDLAVEHDSASGAWVAIEQGVLESRGIKRDKVTVRGTEMFGLSHPIVSMLIQELPNVDKCLKFSKSKSFYQASSDVVDNPAPAG